jgi:hypothetical protein
MRSKRRERALPLPYLVPPLSTQQRRRIRHCALSATRDSWCASDLHQCFLSIGPPFWVQSNADSSTSQSAYCWAPCSGPLETLQRDWARGTSLSNRGLLRYSVTRESSHSLAIQVCKLSSVSPTQLGMQHAAVVPQRSSQLVQNLVV